MGEMVWEKRLIDIVQRLEKHGIDPQSETFWEYYRTAPFDGDVHNAVNWAIDQTRRVNLNLEAQRHRQKTHQFLNNFSEGNTMVDQDNWSLFDRKT